MSDEATERFVALYTAAKRVFYRNEWIQPPKMSSREWGQLDKARKVCDELGGNYPEFIQVQVDAFRHYHKFPLPAMLGTQKAIQRYKGFLLRHRKTYASLFIVDGDSFLVTRTGSTYPLAQVESTLQEDATAGYAAHISGNLPEVEERKRDTVVRALEYYLAKLAYKKKIPPDNLLRALTKYRKEEDGKD